MLSAGRKTHGALAVAGLALCAMAGRDLPAAAELVTLLRSDADFKAHLEDPSVKQAITAVRPPPAAPTPRLDTNETWGAGEVFAPVIEPVRRRPLRLNCMRTSSGAAGRPNGGPPLELGRPA